MALRIARRTALALLVLLLQPACRDKSTTSEADPTGSGAKPVLGPPQKPPSPRLGMQWIPGGALVAGTPPDNLPRVADEEMPGEQVILKGFYIDSFPYPNEEGAIPLTNVAHPEAAKLCGEAGKRLCSELEWERACKGPDNHTYEYGDEYRADRCGTGAPPSMRPSGIKVGCRSDFGVRDLHGGVWEWTDSPWGRGSERELYTTRGGNAAQGELVGRCANATGRPPTSKGGSVGFRCCSGERNDAEVTLDVKPGRRLEPQNAVDRKLAKLLVAKLPEEAKQDVDDDFHMERYWIWKPIGNEQLVVMGGCSGIATEPACGLLIARLHLDKPTVLAWASSGHWAPVLHTDSDARDLWMIGGDELGSFKRLIAYTWGKLSVGPKERRLPKPNKKTKKRGKR